MNNSNTGLSIEWDNLDLNINGETRKYPLLKVVIWGSLKLSEVLTFMDKIKEETETFTEEYISSTDIINLKPSKLLEWILNITTSNSIKFLIGVQNAAKLSFVILGKDSEMKQLRKRLESLNDINDEDDYSYNYIFIEEETELKNLAEKALSEK